MRRTQEREETHEDIQESVNALDMLRDDHRKVEGLFEQFEQADNRSRQRIADEALSELEIHAQLEEKLIYPAIRDEVDADELMDMALEEHHVAKTLIKELRKMAPRDQRYTAKFKVLAESVKHHIKEEEGEIMPKAEETDLDFNELGRKAMQRKEALMVKGGGQRGQSKKKPSPSGRNANRKRRAA